MSLPGQPAEDEVPIKRASRSRKFTETLSRGFKTFKTFKKEVADRVTQRRTLRSVKDPNARFLDEPLPSDADVVSDDAVAFMMAKSRSSLADQQEESPSYSAWRKKLHSLVKSQQFVLSVALVIAANAVYMGIEVDANDGGNSAIFDAVEIIFSAVFAMELVLRLASTMPIYNFFLDGWNLFDVLIVTVAIVDNVIVLSQRRTSELNKLSTLRLFRLTRIVRVFRLLRILNGFWKLVLGIWGAAWTLFWTWMLLLLAVYVFSLVATRLIGQPNQGDPMIDEYFGTVGRSMFSLFQITTTEAWADVAREVMKSEPWTAGFFILYLHVTTFAILNVMIAVIVESTLDEADGFKSKLMEQRLNTQKLAYQKIYKVFKQADMDGDENLTEAEFMARIQDPEIKEQLEKIGVNVREAENLFSILDYDDSGSLDAEEFVHGLLKAVGPAKSKDILGLHFELKRTEAQIRNRLVELQSRTEEQLAFIEDGVATLREEVRSLAAALHVALPAPRKLQTRRESRVAFHAGDDGVTRLSTLPSLASAWQSSEAASSQASPRHEKPELGSSAWVEDIL